MLRWEKYISSTMPSMKRSNEQTGYSDYLLYRLDGGNWIIPDLALDCRDRKMKVPSPVTLKKYGLSEKEWTDLYLINKGNCPICGRVLEKPVVDHLHVRNWKKMKPEKRKMYVRGLPCNYCNRRRLAKGMTLEIARNIVTYLERFEARMPR